MGNSKHPTLAEVAKRAGVGTTTVSRVINGGNLVDPRTLARVRDAIKALGYIPNPAARALKGYYTKTIGLIIPSIADPFFSSCAEAAQTVAHTNGSLLIVTTTQNDPAMERDSIAVLVSHRVDGLIIAPSDSESFDLRSTLEEAGVPVVALDRPVLHSSLPYVLADNFAGTNLATQHLISHGYRRIACITGEQSLYTIRERIKGYRQAMEAAGLPVILNTEIRDHETAETAVAALLRGANPPDAFLTLKNSTTIFTFEALRKMNVSIPEQAALLGYDDFELAATVTPSITVVRQPIDEIGRSAAEILFQELTKRANKVRRPDPTVPRQVQLGTSLVRRGSCGCGPLETSEPKVNRQ